MTYSHVPGITMWASVGKGGALFGTFLEPVFHAWEETGIWLSTAPGTFLLSLK